LKFYHFVLFVQFQGPVPYSTRRPVGLLVLKIKKMPMSIFVLPKVC